VRDGGFQCAGQSVPQHVCDPLAEPTAAQQPEPAKAKLGRNREHAAYAEHEAHARHAAAASASMPSPHEAMGHGGHTAMSMDDMVRNTRNRFLVAPLLSVPILLYSPIGREVLGFAAAGRRRRSRQVPAGREGGIC
jgi:Cu2+-exporting ATPase